MKSYNLFILILIVYLNSGITLACSVLTYSDNQTVLFANNEDSPIGEEPILTFIPSNKNKLGYFYLKLLNIQNPLVANYPQGGMNEKGLAYDITATPLKKAIELIIPQNTPYPEDNLMIKVLSEASTVNEALNIITTYKASNNIRRLTGLSEFRQMQVLLSDRKGNAVVVGIGRDGNFKVTEKQGNYHLVTNFSLAQPENSLVSENRRYKIAQKMLSKLDYLTVPKLKNILSAIHVEGIASTLYSTIYDLQSLDIYLYNFHNYDFQKKINLHAELKKGEHSIPLRSLFKDTPIFSMDSMNELVESIKLMQSQMAQTENELKICKEQLGN